MDLLLAKDDFTGLKTLIEGNKIKCAVSETCNWTDIRQFNLMFSTEFGNTASSDGEDNKIYLRPETAQGIFVNFLNVQKTGRMKIPFGIAQIGKAFRNEIAPRDFIFRVRELEQMEIEYFIHPNTWKENFEQYFAPVRDAAVGRNSNLRSISESLAPYYHYAKAEGVSSAAAPALLRVLRSRPHL